MPLKDATRRTLGIAFANRAVANDIADRIDAGTTTLTDRLVRRFRTMMGSKRVADPIIAKIEASAALVGRQQQQLAVALADNEAAADIASILAS